MKETRKYKQTELGLLPEDWEVARLGDCTNITSGGTPNTMNDEYWGGDVPWMNSGDLNKKIVNSVDGRITENGVKYSSTHWIPKECILIGLAGQGKTRGTAAFNVIPLCINQSIAAIYPCNCFESKFVYYYFETQYKNLRILSDGGGGRGGLTKRMLQDIEIPLPPIEEQRRIASALTSIDNLIDSLDRLIAKKLDIKQGAMQQLLTGKKRLKGFSEPWVEKKLGDVASQKSYGVGAEAIGYNGVDKYIRITDITDDGTYLPAPLSSPSFYQSCHIVGENDLLIARTGASVGKTYLYNPSDERLIFAGFLMKIHIVNADSHFVFYLTQTTLFKQWVVSESMRSGQPGINLQQISSWTFFAPSLPEQQSIASVLTSMDNELSALEAKCKKYEQIKQGMMQQLLTGKIRLENASMVL